MKTTRRPALSAAQSAYAVAKAACDLAWTEYQMATAANDDEDPTEAERVTWAVWAAAKENLRAAERAMVDAQAAKLRKVATAAQMAEVEYVTANAKGDHWQRVVDLAFRAA